MLKASGQKWSPDLCRTCPVPGILLANACEFLQLRGMVARPVGAAFQRRVQVSAFCEKTFRSVAEPHIGCGECHPLPATFEIKK